ncbi:hypothetical protein AgCh_021139 [Apium graveolens]
MATQAAADNSKKFENGKPEGGDSKRFGSGGLNWENKEKITGKGRYVQESNLNSRSYAKVITGKGLVGSKPEVEQGVVSSRNDDDGWTLVQRKKKPKGKGQILHKIFLYGIPDEVKARDMWSCFKGCGVILDIILPRKRDKNNRRFGFVKTISEGEAGKIILNAKEKGGLAAKIKMSIIDNGMSSMDAGRNFNNKVRDEKKGVHWANTAKLEEAVKNKPDKKESLDGDLGTKMFKFTEARIVYENIEEGLMVTLVGYTKLDNSSATIQKEMDREGFDDIQVVGLIESKFLIQSRKDDGWESVEQTKMEKWFFKIRKSRQEDLIVPLTDQRESIFSDENQGSYKREEEIKDRNSVESGIIQMGNVDVGKEILEEGEIKFHEKKLDAVELANDKIKGNEIVISTLGDMGGYNNKVDIDFVGRGSNLVLIREVRESVSSELQTGVEMGNMLELRSEEVRDSSSQNSICAKIGQLKMKGNRGRPRNAKRMLGPNMFVEGGVEYKLYRLIEFNAE